jgi:hypothetical protein
MTVYGNKIDVAKGTSIGAFLANQSMNYIVDICRLPCYAENNK